jgi:hypothetical protein
MELLDRLQPSSGVDVVSGPGGFGTLQLTRTTSGRRRAAGAGIWRDSVVTCRYGHSQTSLVGLADVPSSLDVAAPGRRLLETKDRSDGGLSDRG